MELTLLPLTFTIDNYHQDFEYTPYKALKKSRSRCMKTDLAVNINIEDIAIAGANLASFAGVLRWDLT